MAEARTASLGLGHVTARRKAVPASRVAPLFPILLVSYLALLPPQAALSAGVVVLPFYRVALICLVPWLVYFWASRAITVSKLDGLMVLAMGWIFVALGQSEGASRAIESGGASVVDVAVTYFLARASFRTPTDLRRYLILILPGYLLATASVALETFTGRYIVQPFFISIFGSAEQNFSFQIANTRFGLIRGTGAFPHPILAGLQLASLFPLFFLSRIIGWPRWAGIMASFSAVFTLSSAAVIMLVTQIGGVAYDVLSSKFPQLTWKLAIFAALVGFVVLEILSDRSAITVIMTFTALDPWTAYYRILIWDYGMVNVQAHPWFGIGFAEWVRPPWMPATVDNYWLLIAMQYGIPEASLRFALPIIAVFILAHRSNRLHQIDRPLARGLALCLFFFTLLGFSVALWNNTQVWFNILTGAAVALAVHARTLPRN